MTLSGHTGSVVKWQKQVDGGGWSDISKHEHHVFGDAVSGGHVGVSCGGAEWCVRRPIRGPEHRGEPDLGGRQRG